MNSVNVPPLNQPTWFRAIAQPGQEFPLTPLPVLSGQIPEGLRGSLYRNGPGRLERGGRRVGHWFDGDGAILAVHFTAEGAQATYRYVQTAGYQAEESARQFIYAGYGMTAPGWIWERWGKPVKNVANTSVLAMPDQLLALWEGGHPHALDRQTLATIGPDNLQGALASHYSYSAHPKRDPQTGDIFNFGVTPGRNSTLNLYQMKASGAMSRTAQVPVEGIPFVHDFVLAGRYLVFCVPPVRINFLPVLLCIQSFSDAMTWQPDQGTQIMIIDRETLTLVSQSIAEPWYQWHFANGYVNADGHVVIDVVRYDDFSTNQYLKEVVTGHTQTVAESELWRICLDPQSAQVIAQEPLLDCSCEFPTRKPHQVGQSTDSIYLSIHRPGVNIAEEMYGAIAHFNPETGTLTQADAGAQRYPSEPLYAPHPDDPNRGWILTVVFAGQTASSEVWIYDSEALSQGPICRLGLPEVIPLGFHGTWARNDKMMLKITGDA